MALPAGWYPVAGDPPGTQRYWDGDAFTTGPKQTTSARAGFARPNSATKWKMATAPARLIATLIDYGAPLAIVLGMGNAIGADVPDWSLEGWTGQPRLLGALLACMLFNQVILVGFNGMSLGGILLGLRVVDARDKDRPPGFTRALARFLLEIPGLLVTVFLYVLGRRQAFNDVATGTALVYV